MLSGSMILSNEKNSDYKFFYSKIFKKIVILTILFSVLFFSFRIINDICMIIANGIPTSIILKSIKELVKGKPYYHLWYLYMIIEVYLLTPIVIRFKNSISTNSFRLVSWIFLILCFFSSWTGSHMLNWDVGFAFEYLGYYIIGYELKEHFCKKTNNLKGLIFIFFMQ